MTIRILFSPKGIQGLAKGGRMGISTIISEKKMATRICQRLSLCSCAWDLISELRKIKSAPDDEPVYLAHSVLYVIPNKCASPIFPMKIPVAIDPIAKPSTARSSLRERE